MSTGKFRESKAAPAPGTISRRGFGRAAAALSMSAGATGKPASAAQPVSFPAPWTSPYRADPLYPHHLVNAEGRHLFILNKTGWAYFACKDPAGFLERAKQQGVNVIRVALEGTPYFSHLNMEMWPWGGSRENPDWAGFNEAYWRQVEERIRLAGDAGIGLDVVLYFTLKPDRSAIESQRAYWENCIRRLARYANVLTWEICNEYVRNEEFQDAAAAYFKSSDPWKRPVCTSDGTTDDAIWPHKPWMDLAIVHTCTGSTPAHDLKDWYQSVARNTRSYGKPAFNNESGRENRHKNDDAVHRRKQGWTWCACGAYWTWHTWEGCEGIDDPDYRGPGAAYLPSMCDFFRSIEFWRFDPNFTALTLENSELVVSTLARADRSEVVSYVCTRKTGERAVGAMARIRLPNGTYKVSFVNPVDLKTGATRELVSRNLGQVQELELAPFTDDLLIRIQKTSAAGRTAIPGTN